MDYLRSEVKQFLINYFDWTKSEIDFCAQKCLINLEDADKRATRDMILKIYQDMIDTTVLFYNENAKACDVYFNSSESSKIFTTKDEVLLNTVNQFLIYFGNEKLNSKFQESNPVGLLIVCDWYLNQNQINFLR
jgi:hypothetical protein